MWLFDALFAVISWAAVEFHAAGEPRSVSLVRWSSSPSVLHDGQSGENSSKNALWNSERAVQSSALARKADHDRAWLVEKQATQVLSSILSRSEISAGVR